MPVGTQATLKGITNSQIKQLDPKIMLSNTYFLNLRPGIDILELNHGIQKFTNINTNFLTDSGGFQMVSLLDLTEFTEQGVYFTSPINSQRLLLTPEESVRTQQAIHSDIIMCLDDVVSAELQHDRDYDRIKLSVERTTRWLDRCITQHQQNITGAIFAICQGHLDNTPGGFRDQCIDDIIQRTSWLDGIAIGGLSGGEAKSDFWQTVRHCCQRLPKELPRYLMGVGQPVDLVVCAALGVDMFDCVYATRTGRFGTCMTRKGEINLTREAFKQDYQVMEENCQCEVCKAGFTRAYINYLFKQKEMTGSTMVSIHNVHFLLQLMKDVRQAIINDQFEQFVQQFMKTWYQGKQPEQWVIDALNSVNIKI